MNKIAVLGSGLLGGSMALAVQKRLPDWSVCLWGRREASVDESHQQGIKHATTHLEEAVNGASIIVLSTPVGAMLNIIESVASAVSLDGVIITDVGSVKLTPRNTLEDVIKASGAKYIGSHPMAGSEQAGVAAARADLFDGAACVMTNDFHYSEADVSTLSGIWEALGCRCFLTSSEDHDRVMARISHLPHILASVGALVGLDHLDDGKFAGNGMRDTTRVASGHPEMWSEILLRNRASLQKPIEETIGHLREVLTMLKKSDDKKLVQFLTEAKDLRDQL